MSIQIAEGKPEDVPGIQKVFYETWLATYPNEEAGITREDIEYRQRNAFTEETIEARKKTLREMPSEEKFLVAKNNDDVVGVCYLIKKEDRNQLQALYVLPAYQGQGIGKLFWEEALAFFGPEKDIYVDVAEYNQKAIEFYKKLGFADTGKRFEEERFRMKSGSILREMEMVIKVN